MSKINNIQLEMLKFSVIEAFFSSPFFDRLRSKTAQDHQRLRKLDAQLRAWNHQRIAQKTAAQQSTQLTAEDVAVVKQMITHVVSQTAIKHPEALIDQVFFLSIGAIQTELQTESQTGAERAWQLVHQSIASFLNLQRDKKPFAFGVFFTMLLVLITLRLIIPVHPYVMPTPSDDPATMQEQGSTDPVTMSMLVLAYNKMKSGTCQLPQAAMLPPEQRQAFLLFVNSGYIEVNHVENLRLALGYVNCLYPQELMHPSSDASKL